LGRISHWKVAGSFATTLMALVDTQDLFWPFYQVAADSG
jgi:hypothetical protein